MHERGTARRAWPRTRTARADARRTHPRVPDPSALQPLLGGRDQRLLGNDLCRNLAV